MANKINIKRAIAYIPERQYNRLAAKLKMEPVSSDRSFSAFVRKAAKLYLA